MEVSPVYTPKAKVIEGFYQQQASLPVHKTQIYGQMTKLLKECNEHNIVIGKTPVEGSKIRTDLTTTIRNLQNPSSPNLTQDKTFLSDEQLEVLFTTKLLENGYVINEKYAHGYRIFKNNILLFFSELVRFYPEKSSELSIYASSPISYEFRFLSDTDIDLYSLFIETGLKPPWKTISTKSFNAIDILGFDMGKFDEIVKEIIAMVLEQYPDALKKVDHSVQGSIYTSKHTPKIDAGDGVSNAEKDAVKNKIKQMILDELELTENEAETYIVARSQYATLHRKVFYDSKLGKVAKILSIEETDQILQQLGHLNKHTIPLNILIEAFQKTYSILIEQEQGEELRWKEDIGPLMIKIGDKLNININWLSSKLYDQLKKFLTEKSFKEKYKNHITVRSYKSGTVVSVSPQMVLDALDNIKKGSMIGPLIIAIPLIDALKEEIMKYKENLN